MRVHVTIAVEEQYVLHIFLCACVCMRARARARECVCVRACVGVGARALTCACTRVALLIHDAEHLSVPGIRLGPLYP